MSVHMLFPVGTKVSVHPYRTARVLGPCIDLNRTDHQGEMIENTLCKLAECSPDNHVVYEVSSVFGDNQKPLYVWCTDDLIRIGSNVLIENW